VFPRPGKHDTRFIDWYPWSARDQSSARTRFDACHGIAPHDLPSYAKINVVGFENGRQRYCGRRHRQWF